MGRATYIWTIVQSNSNTYFEYGEVMFSYQNIGLGVITLLVSIGIIFFVLQVLADPPTIAPELNNVITVTITTR